MADVFRLANISQTDTLDLLDDTLKLELRTWGTNATTQKTSYDYGPYSATPRFDRFNHVIETFSLIGNSTTPNLTLAAANLESYFEAARRFHNEPTNDNSIWLEWNADGESAKRSLLYTGAIGSYRNDVGVSSFAEEGKIIAQVAMERHPFWEPTSFASYGFPVSPISCTGGQWELPEIPGTAPARLWRTTLYRQVGFGIDVSTIWAGIRPEYEGFDDFQSVWDCEDGTVGTDATVTADATAYGGSKVRVTYSTTSLTKRLSITVKNVCDATGVGGSGWNDHIGRYIILLRCKVTAGTSMIQMRYGYSNNTRLQRNQNVFVSNTNWLLVEVGEVQFPQSGLWYGLSSSIRNAAIEIWAEEVSGSSTSLDLDCMILIPSEHAVRIEDEISQLGSVSSSIYLYTTENDSQVAFTSYDGYPSLAAPPALRDWYLPTGNNLMVLAGNQDAAHVLTDSIFPRIDYYTRWRSYRNDSVT